MSKKLTILIVILIMLCAFIGCNEKKLQHYDGVINMCERVNDEEFVLLYHNIIYTDQTETPVYEDTLSKYNIKTQENEFLFTVNDLWTSYDDQIKAEEERMIYENEVKRTEFTKTNGEWQSQTADYSTTPLKMASQSGSKYVDYENGYFKIIDRVSFKSLAQIALSQDESKMIFSADENYIAMISDDRSVVSLWDWQNDEITRLNVGKELSKVENWVEISDIVYSESDKYLFITYLCENGYALDVWDMEAEKVVDYWTFAGDIRILDIYGDKLLLSMDEGKDQHTLYVYDAAESLAEREKSTNFYTSGSFINEKSVLVNKYDTAEKINNLVTLEI